MDHRRGGGCVRCRAAVTGCDGEGEQPRAVLESGSVVCWGDNSHGQAGRGSWQAITTVEAATPSGAGWEDLIGRLAATQALDHPGVALATFELASVGARRDH